MEVKSLMNSLIEKHIVSFFDERIESIFRDDFESTILYFAAEKENYKSFSSYFKYQIKITLKSDFDYFFNASSNEIDNLTKFNPFSSLIKGLWSNCKDWCDIRFIDQLIDQELELRKDELIENGKLDSEGNFI